MLPWLLLGLNDEQLESLRPEGPTGVRKVTVIQNLAAGAQRYGPERGSYFWKRTRALVSLDAHKGHSQASLPNNKTKSILESRCGNVRKKNNVWP